MSYRKVRRVGAPVEVGPERLPVNTGWVVDLPSHLVEEDGELLPGWELPEAEAAPEPPLIDLPGIGTAPDPQGQADDPPKEGESEQSTELRAQGLLPVDPADATVKEIRQVLAWHGVTIPAGVTKKADLLALVPKG